MIKTESHWKRKKTIGKKEWKKHGSEEASHKLMKDILFRLLQGKPPEVVPKRWHLLIGYSK